MQGGHANREFRARLACADDWSMVSRTMGDSKLKRKISKAERDRRTRQAASLSKTLASREARSRMSAAAKRALADPEVRARRGAAIKKALADPRVRARMSVGIKKAWTPERREAQRVATKKIMANPEQNARRIAGLARASSDPQLKALRIANLKEALADPVVNKRRIEKMKQTLHTPEVNARRSARLKKMHADARAGLAALKEIAKAENRGPGHPTKAVAGLDVYKEAAILQEREGASRWTWRNLARKFDPDFDENEKAAMGRVRVGVGRYLRSKKQETPQ